MCKTRALSAHKPIHWLSMHALLTHDTIALSAILFFLAHCEFPVVVALIFSMLHEEP